MTCIFIQVWSAAEEKISWHHQKQPGFLGKKLLVNAGNILSCFVSLPFLLLSCTLSLSLSLSLLLSFSLSLSLALYPVLSHIQYCR